MQAAKILVALVFIGCGASRSYVITNGNLEGVTTTHPESRLCERIHYENRLMMHTITTESGSKKTEDGLFEEVSCWTPNGDFLVASGLTLPHGTTIATKLYVSFGIVGTSLWLYDEDINGNENARRLHDHLIRLGQAEFEAAKKELARQK